MSDLSQILRRPGAANDLYELTKLQVPLANAAVGSGSPDCSDSDSVWLQAAMVCQLVALPHYARLLQAWGPVRMYAFMNAPQLVVADGENEDGGNEAEAPCSASR